MSRSAARRRRACAAARTFSRSTTSSCIGSERERRARSGARASSPARAQSFWRPRARSFFLDFGPLNLGQLWRFCMKLNDKLQDPALKGKVIYFYCGQHPHRRANAAFLIAAWAMMYLGQARAPARAPAAPRLVRASALALSAAVRRARAQPRARASRLPLSLSRTDARGGVPPVPRRVPAVPAVPRRVAVRVHVRPHGARLPARAREGDEVQLLRQREL